MLCVPCALCDGLWEAFCAVFVLSVAGGLLGDLVTLCIFGGSAVCEKKLKKVLALGWGIVP